MGGVGRRAVLGAGLAGAAGLLAGCSSSGGGGGRAAASASGRASARASGSGTASPSGSATASASASPSVSAGAARGSVRVVGTVAQGLNVPWGMALLPDRTLLVGSRDTFQLHHVDPVHGSTTLVGTVPGVVSTVGQGGEAGLLGLALSPGFAQDRLVHLYCTTAHDNRVVTVRWDDSAAAGRQLGAPRPVLTGIPRGVHHDGGRIAFGPHDGLLYVGTGDTEDKSLPQNRGSLAGKILRITAAGKPAPGNPFGDTPVYTYGHRNVQGLAFDPAGRLWASELGDREADELNLIESGRDYGWPATQGRTDHPGYTSPVAQFGTETDSPSGIAWAAGCIWMAALKGERLWRIPLDGTRTAAAPQSFLDGTHGRLRTVVADRDGTLLVTTSNTDGRTPARSGDDRILRLAVT